METADMNIDELIAEIGERHRKKDGEVNTKAAEADLAACLAELPPHRLIEWIVGKCVITHSQLAFNQFLIGRFDIVGDSVNAVYESLPDDLVASGPIYGKIFWIGF